MVINRIKILCKIILDFLKDQLTLVPYLHHYHQNENQYYSRSKQDSNLLHYLLFMVIGHYKVEDVFPVISPVD